MGYTPPYTVTDKIINYISEISEKIGNINYVTKLNSKPVLRKNSQIKSIHSSLKIEANSLSLNQVRDIINGHTVLGRQSEITEVKNAYSAYDLINEINPYKLDDLLKIHKIMTKSLLTDNGKFRNGQEGVFDGDKYIFVAPPAKFVPNLMNELFDWMYTNKNTVHPLIISAVFHYEFVFIHPFSDGNGRMARFWHNAILYNWKSVFEFIPIENQIEKFQTEYYDTIAVCHKNGNSTAFIEFILQKINEIIDDIISQINNSAADI